MASYLFVDAPDVWEDVITKSAPEQVVEHLFIPGASPAIEELTDEY